MSYKQATTHSATYVLFTPQLRVQTGIFLSFHYKIVIKETADGGQQLLDAISNNRVARRFAKAFLSCITALAVS